MVDGTSLEMPTLRSEVKGRRENEVSETKLAVPRFAGVPNSEIAQKRCPAFCANGIPEIVWSSRSVTHGVRAHEQQHCIAGGRINPCGENKASGAESYAPRVATGGAGVYIMYL